ncbi:MAG: PIN domain-containing protein [Thermoleophilia bacterium]
MGAWYVDASAAAKLVGGEEHHEAMRAWTREHEDSLVSCDLLRTELLRAIRRRDPSAAPAVAALLESFELTPLPRSLFDAAGSLEPVTLRTPDALHLAAALALGDDLAGIVTYDLRLADAARHRSVRVVSPGAA